MTITLPKIEAVRSNELINSIALRHRIDAETLKSTVNSIFDCAANVVGAASDEIDRREDVKQGEAWLIIEKHVSAWMVSTYLEAKHGVDVAKMHEPESSMSEDVENPDWEKTWDDASDLVDALWPPNTTEEA